MSATIIMPQLGETVAEGKILTWFKSVGDDIKPGDKLFEVETDKVTVDVEAIVAGRLTDIRVAGGGVAKVGAVVAVVNGDGKADLSPVAIPVKLPTAAPARGVFDEVNTPTAKFGNAKGPEGLRITPLARRLIAQNGLDTAAIARTVAARDGKKIYESDVREALAGQALAAATVTLPVFADGEIVPLNAIRLKTGERLAENWRMIPHVFQAIEIDFTKVDAVRAKHKEGFRAANGVALTYLPFIARATCLALHAFPHVNARFDGKALTLSKDVNLGIAVDLNHRGLVVPIVRAAQDYTLPGLAKAIGRQIGKARNARLTADDLAGGTYTITNNGAFGTAFTAPIINAPQVAILSTDAIRKKPAVVTTPEGDFIAVRLMGMVGQSFDHRAFDGAYAAAFLSRLKEIIETRDWGDELGEQP